MARPLITILIACCCTAFSSGCFVLEQLDDGEALMNDHAPPKPGAAAAATEDESGSMFGESGSAKLDEMKGKLEEAMKREPHPDNVIVRCELDGRDQYTRKFDCQTLGGRIVMR